jgi:glycolate oxidase iron-sulfur subunit
LEPGGPQRAASVRDRPEPDGVHREVEDRRRVALLRGCVQRGLFDRVQRATIAVLDVNGCTVTDAGPDQGCCGALHAHAGDLEGARRLARKNIEAFAADPEVPLLVDAAGCSAAMKDYGHWLAGDPHWAERAQRLSDRVVDATAWLATRELLVGAPLVGRVALHPPCHLQHAQGLGDAPRRVLERAVPGLELAVADRATECCGGAGVYGLTQPLLGDRLGAEKAAALAATGAVCVATGNPGCMMHIAAHLGDADIDVAHPVELLYESYRRAGLAD